MQERQNKREPDGLGSVPKHSLYYTKWYRDDKGGIREDGVRYIGGQQKKFYRFSEGESLEWHRIPGGRDEVGVIAYKDGRRVLLDDWIKACESNQKSVLRTVKQTAEEFHAALLEQLKPASPEKQSAAGTIFDNIYDIKRKKEKPDDLIKLAGDRVGWYIEPLEKENSRVLFGEIWNNMAKYLVQNRNEKDYEKRKGEVEKCFLAYKEHVDTKVITEKAVNPLTAKVFLRIMPKLKQMRTDYNDIVNNPDCDLQELGGKKGQGYANKAKNVFDSHPGKNKTEDATFYHFNTRDSSSHPVLYRIYISANLREEPTKVLSNFMAALEETGLKDKIYFKIPYWHGPRFESVVIYANENVSGQEMKKLLSAFKQKTPDQLLAKDDMPAAVPLTSGLSLAPEPITVNRILKFSGFGGSKLSYNEMVADLMELSFMMAYHEHKKTGKKGDTPGSLRKTAKKYFEQFLIMAGLDPKTMLHTTGVEQKMAWVGELADEFKKPVKKAA